ncbi:hypothetical protein F5B21DRAFT_507703 [Xylaria acuta]|nr:hypothetical protein F5B21DRAFT_507703 [Xylaria acuta]
MATFKNAYTDYYDNALKYEFVTEVSPKVWKITRKDDRMEYLAHDITDTLLIDLNKCSVNSCGADKCNPLRLTSYGRLFAPDGENLLEQVKTILNHPNLVSLVDCFALQFSNSGKGGREQWFTVWDYCDAGNIGNLLVPAVPRPQDHDPSEIFDEDDDLEFQYEYRAPKFLPESFCWHVLTSVLRALMWLHDGVRDVRVAKNHTWQRVYENLDWQPMLHRNIHPQNIFIGYPRRKEWYGPVKLGNYGRLYVSGHCQTPGDEYAPIFSKVIGPPPEQKFARLEDMIASDTDYGSVYPHQRNQPYTMVSEYRAVGEIIQAMMIEPVSSKHVKRIQAQSARLNLEDLDYTGRLKNFLVKLMEFDPWEKVPGAEKPNPTYVTSDLYREALEGVEWFMNSGKDEVDSYVTSYMAEADDYVENTALKATQMFDSFHNVQEILEQFTDKT